MALRTCRSLKGGVLTSNDSAQIYMPGVEYVRMVLIFW